jgi:ankyrin repeat protein
MIARTVLYCCISIGIIGFGISRISAYEENVATAYFQAIRSDNQSEIRRLAASNPPATVADGLKTTPLHYAALYGSVATVRVLLAAGAVPNARDVQDNTALILAAYDANKTRTLVEAGAAVNVRNHVGQTPLLIAASTQANAATVEYVLKKGADPRAVNSFGAGTVIDVTAYGDTESLRALLAGGADPRAKDSARFSTLMNAVTAQEDGSAEMLLKAGVEVNEANTFGGMVKNGPLALVGLTPLMFASPYGPPQTVAKLLGAGAHVNAVDIRKMSPLMLAVATDCANPETVRCLIKAGADVNQKDRNGESVLDWAKKFGNPEIIEALEKAGAQPAQNFTAPARPADYRAENASAALGRSTDLLARSGQGFFREGGGCWGCHHQPMDARAYAAMRRAGLGSDERLRKVLLDAVVAGRPRFGTSLPNLIDLGGDVDTLISPLAALADLGEPASADTDRMVHYLAARQQPGGSWHFAGVARPPIEESDISRTALAVRALKTYGWPARAAEFEGRIARGRSWLEQAEPRTNYERADLVMGLFYAGAQGARVQKAATALLTQQRADGGWSQTRYLDSDAYATGMALHALYVTGKLRAQDPAYQRGVQYLLATQFPDGSWYVRSRAPKFQPYFQSGFPFNHDQWISSTATAWAAMALAPAAAAEKP